MMKALRNSHSNSVFVRSRHRCRWNQRILSTTIREILRRDKEILRTIRWIYSAMPKTRHRFDYQRWVGGEVSDAGNDAVHNLSATQLLRKRHSRSGNYPLSWEVGEFW